MRPETQPPPWIHTSSARPPGGGATEGEKTKRRTRRKVCAEARLLRSFPKLRWSLLGVVVTGKAHTAVFAVVALAVALNMAFKKDGFAVAEPVKAVEGATLVALLAPDIPPEEMLAALHAIERAFGGNEERIRNLVAGIENQRSALHQAALLISNDTNPLINRLENGTKTLDVIMANAQDTLGRLLPGGYVINVARGAHLVDEDLVAAIDSGHVAGATLDVFRTEPLPAGHAFWTHPRITITPHTSARTLRDESIAQIARKMVALEHGEAVAGIVNPARGY